MIPTDLLHPYCDPDGERSAVWVPGALGYVEEDLGGAGGVDFGFGFPQDGVRNDTKWHPPSAYSGLSS